MKCKICKQEAVVSLRSHNAAFCEECYRAFFRRQLQRGIESQKLFTRDERILVALSGGKDSLTLMLELTSLGYKAEGLFIDLGIPKSSALARRLVENFCATHALSLRIVELAAEGLAIPEVKAALHRPVCSACGKIKRYFFNRIAMEGGYDALATGHNLDDEVSRLMSNTLRWDGSYLSGQGPLLPAGNGFCRKVKPLWRLTEFEIANYAFLARIEHHLSSCPYSAGASFSVIKNWINGLERKMPGRKLDFYIGFLERGRSAFGSLPVQRSLTPCQNCGNPTSSGEICGVCRIQKAVRSLK